MVTAEVGRWLQPDHERVNRRLGRQLLAKPRLVDRRLAGRERAREVRELPESPVADSPLVGVLDAGEREPARRAERAAVGATEVRARRQPADGRARALASEMMDAAVGAARMSGAA